MTLNSETYGFGRILRLIAPYWRSFALITGLALVDAAIRLAAPWVAGKVVNAALLEKNVAQLDHIALLLLGLFALGGLVGFTHVYFLRATGARMLCHLRQKVFGHLIHMAPSFFDTERIGELLSRLGDDLSKLQSTLVDKVPGGFRSLVMFVGTLIILFRMDMGLTLMTLVVVPAVVATAMWYGKRLERSSKQAQTELARSTGDAEEALAGIRTVQAFTNEGWERHRYNNSLDGLLNVQLRLARVYAAFSGIVHFVGFASFVLVLWMGGKRVIEGSLSPGELTSFILYVFSIAGSVGSLATLYASLREMRGASSRVFHILDTTSPIIEAKDAQELPSPKGRIEVSDLSFQYATDTTVLEHVSFTIEPGEVVAIVGPSGAGKTTLFSLMHRFYDLSEGQITLDGHDIKSLTLQSLRQAFAMVPQDVFLFSGSVRENVVYGLSDVADQTLWAGLAAAGAQDFVEGLPAKLDEVIGERGIKLSTGQRQRLAVARALLRNPAVLFLDEATSALDAESEEWLTQALARRSTPCTTLIIAHRLATAKRADRILVLSKGKLIAQGTHATLINDNELYKKYWTLQSLDVSTEL